MGLAPIRVGLGWAKSHGFATRQCPVVKYHRELITAILEDRCAIAEAVNATVIALDDAPQGYANSDGGAAGSTSGAECQSRIAAPGAEASPSAARFSAPDVA